MEVAQKRNYEVEYGGTFQVIKYRDPFLPGLTAFRLARDRQPAGGLMEAHEAEPAPTGETGTTG